MMLTTSTTTMTATKSIWSMDLRLHSNGWRFLADAFKRVFALAQLKSDRARCVCTRSVPERLADASSVRSPIRFINTRLRHRHRKIHLDALVAELLRESPNGICCRAKLLSHTHTLALAGNSASANPLEHACTCTAMYMGTRIIRQRHAKHTLKIRSRYFWSIADTRTPDQTATTQ